MADELLQFIAGLVNKEKSSNEKIQVTLNVSGLLVSGYIIPASDFIEQYPLTAKIKEAAEELEKKSGSHPSDSLNSEPKYKRPEFIHLSGAKYFSPGVKPVPDGDGLFVRINLSSVSSFHFGMLQQVDNQ